MTQKQLNRFKVLSLVIEGKVTIQQAAEDLDLSERQIKRLKKGVQQQGPESLIHSNTGRKPSHAVTDQLKAAIIRLKGQEPFINANFTHFQELLAEHEQIHISYTPLYKILTEAGLASPKEAQTQIPPPPQAQGPQGYSDSDGCHSPLNGFPPLRSLLSTAPLTMPPVRLWEPF